MSFLFAGNNFRLCHMAARLKMACAMPIAARAGVHQKPCLQGFLDDTPRGRDEASVNAPP
jgi:hypothetical protein